MPAVAVTAWDPSAEAHGPKIALSVLVALVACAALAFRRQPLVISSSLAWAAAWIAWCAASLAWGSAAGVEQVSAQFAALALALAARSALTRDQIERALLWLGLAVGSAASILAIGEWLAGARGSAVHGGMGNPDWLGLVVAPCILLSAAGWTSFVGLRRAFTGIGLGLQAAGLWLSQSRTAWIAVAVAGVLSLVARRLPKRWPLALVVAAGAAPVLAGLGAHAAAVANGWLAAFEGRRFLWHAASNAALGHFPFGAGSGGFGSAYLRAQGALLADLDLGAAARAFQSPATAHSDWVQTLVEQGPIGALLLAGWLGTTLSSSRSTNRAALLAIAVAAIGDGALDQPAVMVLALLVTAAADGDASVRRMPSMSFLALVALLGLAARVTVGTWLGSRYSTAAREHPEERLALLARARAADPYSPDHCVEHAVALLDGGEPALALAEADAGARRTESVGVELVRAKALSLLGRKPEARAALGRALAYDPASFRANLGLCALELEALRLEASQAAFDRARRVLPGDSRLEPLERRVRAAFRARELGELNTSP